MCMYNVCTLYTTAVGVILPRQLARCLHRNEYDIWCNVCWTLYVQCMYVVCTRDAVTSILDGGLSRVSVRNLLRLQRMADLFDLSLRRS